MNPVRAIAGSCLALAAIAALAACGALVGHGVTLSLFEMKTDMAPVTYRAPGHCTAAGYRAESHPGEGATMAVSSGPGNVPVVQVDVRLKPGATFSFASSTAQLKIPSQATARDVPIPDFSYTEYPRGTRASQASDSVLSGPAPNTPVAKFFPNHRVEYVEAYDFEADVKADPGNAAEFVLQLPDAIVDGKRIQLAPIAFAKREIRYVEDACLR